ncbi:MAG: 2-C-methyl-D-erythritol 4-phosphate cytidylyltransferase [Bacteroidales bacterium]|nr:2-C-methyl-D-erythritol 4-phosphate cytidylyltransferase [Bacteroidales bacterium]MBN2762138.1 2-C-methyl-D-erythritol 4-phosphate cytidylyltransferase [Bacteroidales bacterium]
MKKTVIIVAGGLGSRMKQDLPKQFMLLKGKPVLMHTLNCFYSFDKDVELIVALPQAFRENWQVLCDEHRCSIPHVVVNGGESRFHTVRNSLAAVQGKGLVAVHDGVRPLVSHDTLERCFSTASEKGSAIPCIAVAESLRVDKGTGSIPVDRSLYHLVQTPQVFRWEILQKAYEQDYRPEFTDDAGVVEKAGYAVVLVEGNSENIKITTPADLVVAEALMGAKGTSVSNWRKRPLVP